MTMKNYTHITTLLDRSGSMELIKEATETAYDRFIMEQRTGDGLCTVSQYQFDSTPEKLYIGIPINSVPKCVLVPRGSTALYDAMYYAVYDTGAWLANMPEHQRPDKVLFVTLTDGLENASVKHNRQQVFAQIKEQTEKYNWTFVYLGANQDALRVATDLGMCAGNALNFAGTNEGVLIGVEKMSKGTKKYTSNPDQSTCTDFFA